MYKNEKSKQYHADYRERNKEIIKQKNRKYQEENPWINSFHNAKQRCNNPNNPNYLDYGKRGILFLLTKEEIKFLWFRDKAYKMNFPTIDRKDNDGNYELSNCQFLENNINSQKDRIIPKLYQYSRNGNLRQKLQENYIFNNQILAKIYIVLSLLLVDLPGNK